MLLITEKKLNRIFKNLSDYPILEKRIINEFGFGCIAFWDKTMVDLCKSDRNLSEIKARELTVKIFKKRFLINKI